jgi:hypothetical protein
MKTTITVFMVEVKEDVDSLFWRDYGDNLKTIEEARKLAEDARRKFTIVRVAKFAKTEEYTIVE